MSLNMQVARSLGLSVLLFGCFSEPARPGGAPDDALPADARPDDAGSDARSDAMLPDAVVSATGCTSNSTISSTFTSQTCDPWGHGSGNSTISNAGNSVLRIQPGKTMTNDGACLSSNKIALPTGGIFFKAVTPQIEADGYLSLRLPDTNVELTSADGRLRFASAFLATTYASAPYDANNMTWWRLRPDPSNGTIIGEYSPDAQTWFYLGSITRDLTEMTAISIDAGVKGGAHATLPAFADVDNFNVCP